MQLVGTFRAAPANGEGDDRVGYSKGTVALDSKGDLWLTAHVCSQKIVAVTRPSDDALGKNAADAPAVDMAEGKGWRILKAGGQRNWGMVDVIGKLLYNSAPNSIVISSIRVTRDSFFLGA